MRDALSLLARLYLQITIDHHFILLVLDKLRLGARFLDFPVAGLPLALDRLLVVRRLESLGLQTHLADVLAAGRHLGVD